FSSGHAIHSQQRGFTGRPMGHHDKPGEDDDVDPYLVADLAMTKAIAERLELHYPAHPWMVMVSHAQGIATIKLPVLMKRNQCYVTPLPTSGSAPGMRCVMRPAGELLERLDVPRHGFRLDSFLQARSNGPYGARARPRLLMPERETSARP